MRTPPSNQLRRTRGTIHKAPALLSPSSASLRALLFKHLRPVKSPRIYLSSPHMGGDELPFVQEAFATNWIAPLGPHVDAFEREFC